MPQFVSCENIGNKIFYFYHFNKNKGQLATLTDFITWTMTKLIIANLYAGYTALDYSLALFIQSLIYYPGLELVLTK